MINDVARRSVNVDTSNNIPIATVKEYDDFILKLNLMKYNTPLDCTGQTVTLAVRAPSGLFEQSTDITVKGNQIDIKLKKGIVYKAGTCSMELKLVDATGSMTTASFFIIVYPRILSDGAVQASDEFDSLTKAVNKVEEDYNGLKRIIIDENQAANLQDQINTANSQLVDMTYYVTPEMFSGVSDADKINNALNSPSSTVILKGDYNIDKTIVVPANKTLDLGTSKLRLTSNVDMIHLNTGAKLLSGFISLDSTIETLFDKSIIKLLSTNGISTFQTIKDTQILNSAKMGTAIKFEVSSTSAYIAYANLDNFKIRGFNLGVDITVPNISPHVIGSGYDNWITTCKIHGFISRANQGLRLNDESNNGKSIQGMDIFLRGQAGDKNSNFDEAIYAKCCQSTFNVILDDAGDISTVSNYIVFDKYSSKNNYIGANEKVIDNGMYNIILNNIHYPNLLSVKTSNASALGYINNILFNVDERYTVTHSCVNGTMSPALNVFKATGYTTLITKTDINLETIATYDITFPTTKTIPLFSIKFGSNYSLCKLRFRYGSTWVETPVYNSSQIIANTYDVFKTHAYVDQVQIIITLPADYKSNVNIQNICGYGEEVHRGNFIPRDGGEMYGTLEFMKSWHSIVLRSPSNKKYQIKVSDDGTLTTTLIS